MVTTTCICQQNTKSIIYANRKFEKRGGGVFRATHLCYRLKIVLLSLIKLGLHVHIVIDCACRIFKLHHKLSILRDSEWNNMFK